MFSNNDEKSQCLQILNECGIYGSGWWTRYPKRAVEEIYKMHENTNAVLKTEGSKLIWEEELFNNFNTYFKISIEAGSNFPFEMPDTYVRNSGIDISRAKHMYSGSRLCLMHPSEYHSYISVLEIRNLAAAWCFCAEAYIETGEWPAAEAD